MATGSIALSFLGHIQMAVKLRPLQSHRLKSRKQLTGMKYWSQEPPSASVDLVSAVMAGNMPIVMVKVKQTDSAKIQIFLKIFTMEMS